MLMVLGTTKKGTNFIFVLRGSAERDSPRRDVSWRDDYQIGMPLIDCALNVLFIIIMAVRYRALSVRGMSVLAVYIIRLQCVT